MKDLNSVLLDGTVTEDAKRVDGLVNFYISSTMRYEGHKNKDGLTEVWRHENLIKCSPMEHSAFTNRQVKSLRKGARVRIVGHLWVMDGELTVVVEHLEVRK